MSILPGTMSGYSSFSYDDPGSVNYTVGTYDVLIPNYEKSLTIKIWGAGGGGGGGGSQANSPQPGKAGGYSSFSTLLANGGGGGGRGYADDENIDHVGSNGSPGTASGGDVNTTGGGNAGGSAGGATSGGYRGGYGGPGGYVEKTYGPGELDGIRTLHLGDGGAGGSGYRSGGKGQPATATISWE